MRLRDLADRRCLLLAPAAAQAHPHVWVDVAVGGALRRQAGGSPRSAITGASTKAFPAFALQGLDADGDGTYSPEELQPLAQENVESLADFDFFTFLSVGDYQAGFAAPTDYSPRPRRTTG